MTQEISLTVEETNKLRASLGLRPLPTGTTDTTFTTKPESTKSTNESTKSTNESIKSTKPQTTTNSHVNSLSTVELSIEETNKLRESIGLKPIPIDAPVVSSGSTPVATGHPGLEKRIEQATERAEKRKMLAKRTLYELDEVDTDDWLAGLGSKEKKGGDSKASKSEKLSEGGQKKDKNGKVKSAKAEPGPLESRKIGHSALQLRTLADGEILTLKDNDLEGEDELTHEGLTKKSKLAKELLEKAEAENIKFNGRHYVKHDDEEVEKEEEDVMLKGSTISLGSAQKTEPATTGNVQVVKLFDDELELALQRDYSKPKPTKMKKIKKKDNALRAPKRVFASELAPVELAPIENEPDDDLDEIMAATRRNKQRKRAKLSADDIAREVAMYLRLDAVEEDVGVVYDDTREFLTSLEGNLLGTEEKEEEGKGSDEQGENGELENGHENGENDIEKGHLDNIADAASAESSNSQPRFNSLSSTLKFLQSRNVMNVPNAEQMEHERARREAARESELLKLKIGIEERLLREELAQDRKYVLMPKAEKEEAFDKALDARLLQKGIVPKRAGNNLRKYDPAVRLTYKDETGADLNTKQAFKYMSHQFHGVGPGKKSVEKKDNAKSTGGRVV